MNSLRSSPPANVVYSKFSAHANFNGKNSFYCSSCYRGYQYRGHVKRHHKTVHGTSEDDMLNGRIVYYLEYDQHLDCLITPTMSNSTDHLRPENEPQTEDPDDDWNLSIADVCTVDVIEDEAAAPCMIKAEKNDVEQMAIGDPPEAFDIITLPTEVSVEEPERTFQFSDCAFRSNSGGEMEKHVCSFP
ncbi:unnamed protein product [Didymodactylos carnosus]|uniref:C2H2-type domain-containing protein n=1 Tax=Didymodactylos carnosus TaxID=1234261 RepID=A0A813ZN11_9BILA|nr:unnamed protein product [Didymodactylos carnosus]CAF3683326.1 unnamed protein product [Didymodactylos carnosus]